MTMLLVASCSQDDTLSVDTNSNEALVSFNLELPDSGPQTRAEIGDGLSVNELVYAVYQVNGESLTKIGENHTAKISSKKASVKQSLLKGKTYKIAFWAQFEGNNFYNTDDLTAVEVKYGTANNDETRDAFFKTVEFTVTSDASIDVVMTRPFAQINVGVTQDDYDNAELAGLAVAQSSVVINNAANQINLLTGKATGNATVTYDLAAIPTKPATLIAAGENYKYLSMSYILVVEEKSTLDALTYEFKDTVSGEIVTLTQGLTSVPVQRNYRTNIVGKLLTGDIEFNITIDEIFEGDHNVDDDNAISPDGTFKVVNKEELENALLNDKISTILIGGTIGSKDAYTVYNVKRPVTIQGITTRASEGAKVYGTFIVKSDDVTIDNLAIQNKGDSTGESSTNRGGIYVFAEKITITNNTFTNGLGENAGLSNAIQIMSSKADNPLSNYVVKGNKFIGHANEVTNWSSSAIVIAQGYKPGSIGEKVLAITADQADYINLLENNTFENNKIDVTHQDWTDGKKILYPYTIVSSQDDLQTALNDKTVGVISLSGTIGSESDYTIYEVNRPVTIKGGVSTVTRAEEPKAKVFGTFMVKADDVTIENLAIQNEGNLGGGETPTAQSRGNIIVFAKNVIIKNNTITHGMGDQVGLANAIQIFSSVADNPLSNYVVEGNTVTGFKNEAKGSSSSAILIAEGYNSSVLGKAYTQIITATAADYEYLEKENTFIDNAIDVTHQNWVDGRNVLYPKE